MREKITDDERQLLQYIAGRCKEASCNITKKDNSLTVILSKCEELADRINDYLETN